MDLMIDKHSLPGNATSAKFEGYLNGNVNVSFFVNETPPGKGPSLHKHPYPEIFVVFDGELTCTVGDQTLVLTGGQMAIVPADTPHKFINSGSVPARHIDLHPVEKMETTWLE